MNFNFIKTKLIAIALRENIFGNERNQLNLPLLFHLSFPKFSYFDSELFFSITLISVR